MNQEAGLNRNYDSLTPPSGFDYCAEGLGAGVVAQPGPKGDSDAIAVCHGRASGVCLRYDSARLPFLYLGDYPDDIAPMARVVAIGNQAWALDLLREKGRVESGDLVLTWEAGQNSALDSGDIAEGRDVGNVVVQRRGAVGLSDIPCDMTFAFVFRAFVFRAFGPEGVWNIR